MTVSFSYALQTQKAEM